MGLVLILVVSDATVHFAIVVLSQYSSSSCSSETPAGENWGFDCFILNFDAWDTCCVDQEEQSNYCILEWYRPAPVPSNTNLHLFQQREKFEASI